MRKFIDFVDSELRPGGLLSWIIAFGGVAFFAVMSVVAPEQKYFYLLFVMLGLGGGWRHYVVWNRKSRQRGLVLVGTEEEIEILK